MYCQYFDMFDSWSFGFFDFGLYGTFNRKYRSRCCKIRSWIGIPHLSWTGSEFTRIIYLGYSLLCHATGKHYIINRYRPRFFDQVGHQTTSAYIENKLFFSLNNVIVRPTKIKVNSVQEACAKCLAVHILKSEI